jgi:DNA-binding NarL/FixJ family response regulator
MLRVAILDDHPAVSAGLRRFFDPQHDLTVVAAATTVAELSHQLDGTRAEMLVLDYDLTRSDGLSHCQRIKCRSRAPAVVICSAYSGHALVLAARVAGADGGVDETEPVQHLLAAIRAAAAGQIAMPAVPQDAYEAAIANVDDEDMPVLAMLLDGAPLDAISHALRTDQAEVSWRAQRIVGLCVQDSGSDATTTTSGPAPALGHGSPEIKAPRHGVPSRSALRSRRRSRRIKGRLQGGA